MENLEKVVTAKGRRFLLKVETSGRADDYLKYEELRNEIWDFPEDSLPGTRNMLCENFLHDGSSLFIAVYAEDEKGGFEEDKAHFVGFSYGFVGVKDKILAFKSLDNLQFYSQYTGVRADFIHYGLGIVIKEFQREKLVDVFGVYTITCTYDPLTGVNAYRNIHHFGMEVLTYREDTYGGFGGRLNRADIPTDRFFMSWDLRKKVSRAAYDLNSILNPKFRVVSTETVVIMGRKGPLELEIVRDVNLGLASELLLVQIPRDFYQMLRETDVEDPDIRAIPLEWRMKTRQVFHELFKREYRVIDFRVVKEADVGNYYILRRVRTQGDDLQDA